MAEETGGTVEQPEQPLRVVSVVKQPDVVNPPAAKPTFLIRRSLTYDRYLNALLYGDYGVGKSFLAATAAEVPRMQRVLYINAEGGDASVEHFDMDIIDISNYTQFARVYEFLKVHCRYRDSYKQDSKNKEARDKLRRLEAMFREVDLDEIDEPTLYHTVVGDSLTEIQKYCMYQLLGITIGTFQLDATPDVPELGDWNRSAEMIRLLVRTFRDLPINVIFVCARGETQDQHKRFHYAPLLPGKLGNEIRGFFDVVGYLVSAPTEGGEILRRLWLEPGQTFTAKNRFKDFDALYIDSPSMAELAKYRFKEDK